MKRTSRAADDALISLDHGPRSEVFTVYTYCSIPMSCLSPNRPIVSNHSLPQPPSSGWLILN